MLTSIAAQAALLIGAQGGIMPPTPEQIADRMRMVPQCVAAPATAKSRGESSGQEASIADRIADGMHDALARFPGIACKERNSL